MAGPCSRARSARPCRAIRCSRSASRVSRPATSWKSPGSTTAANAASRKWPSARPVRFFLPIALACSLAAAPAAAQDVKKEIEKYQQMIADSSPAELFELQGEALWKKRQGPKNASLEQCDLGLGAGVLKGAYAQLPRWFKDADRVMDLETRLLHCMTTLQGRRREEATKRVFGTEDAPSEMEYLSAYIAAASRGAPMAA